MACNGHRCYPDRVRGRLRHRGPVAAPLLASLALAGPACAKDTGEQTRKNWTEAVGKADAQRAKQPRSVEAAAVGAEGTTAWERMRAILTRGDVVLARGGGDEAMEVLSERWCAAEPSPQATDHGPVRVCRPEPPLETGGHGLVLEMGSGLGLTAQDLGDVESRELRDRIREEARPLCRQDWRVPAGSPREGIQLQICPLPSGATLALGRFLRDADSGLWQVSITVLGPG